MPARWCCPAFQGHYQNAGERTFSVLVDRDSSKGSVFIFQHRALNPGDELPASLEVPVSTISEVRIHFCPWCGRDLGRWYKRWVDELRRSGLRVPWEGSSEVF